MMAFSIPLAVIPQAAQLWDRFIHPKLSFMMEHDILTTIQTVPQDIGEPMQGLSGHNIGANMQDFHSTNGYAGADNMNDVWSFVEGDRITPMQDIIDVVRPLKRGRFYNGKRPNPFQ